MNGNIPLSCIKCSHSIESMQGFVLKCRHFMCRCCIDKNKEDTFTCLACSIPSPVHQVKNNVIWLENDESLKCQCPEKAIANVKCEECDEMICDQCAVAHKRLKITQNHKLVQIFKLADGCASHPYVACEWYCVTCKVRTCSSCQLSDHGGHEYSRLDDRGRYIKEQCLKKIELLNKSISDKLKLFESSRIVAEQCKRKVVDHLVKMCNEAFEQTFMDLHKKQMNANVNKSAIDALSSFVNSAMHRSVVWQYLEEDFGFLMQLTDSDSTDVVVNNFSSDQFTKAMLERFRGMLSLNPEQIMTNGANGNELNSGDQISNGNPSPELLNVQLSDTMYNNQNITNKDIINESDANANDVEKKFVNESMDKSAAQNNTDTQNKSVNMDFHATNCEVKKHQEMHIENIVSTPKVDVQIETAPNTVPSRIRRLNPEMLLNIKRRFSEATHIDLNCKNKKEKFEDIFGDECTSNEEENVNKSEKEWEEYCSVCQESSGVLIKCQNLKCTRVFHRDDHVPKVPNNFKENKFICSFCVRMTPHKLKKSFDRFTENDFKICERILIQLFCHEEGLPFTKPLPHDQSFWFTDLSTVRDRLHNSKTDTGPTMYKNMVGFLEDINSMFNGCYEHCKGTSMFNSGRLVCGHYVKMVSTYLPVYSSMISQLMYSVH